MTEYEKEVLKAIDKGAGKFGWYKIEQCLSNTFIRERGHLPSVLDAFVARGWAEASSATGNEAYSITAAGRAALD